MLVHRLAYKGDVAAGLLAVFQGGPNRTGGNEAPISGFIRAERATRKNSQLAAARRVALKMGRRLRCSSVTSRTSLTLLPIWFCAADCQTGAGGALLAPCRRPILNATTSPLYARRCTKRADHPQGDYALEVPVHRRRERLSQ
jgi:hypothetical protein